MLDNCEHLIEDVASFTSDLLSACSRLKILATSRESIRIPGEWLYPVPALNVPKESSSIKIETASKFPALTLFAERARAVRPDFALNAENIQAVSSICAQLDGLPLAIELIAARMRLMSPAALLEHWNAQLILSADGVRAVTTRQKTLNNAIAWSYNLLSAEEQKLFAYLSVFSGGFTLEAAESIFSGMFTTKSVSDLIVSLLDKSLLQLASDHKERRFNMLVTIQQFALDRLRRIGDEAGVRNWHLAYFLDLAEQADREIHGPAQGAWMDRLDMELDNFRAALEWCVSNQKTEAALRMFDALGWSWSVRGHYSEMRSWFDEIRALPEIAAHPALYARMLNHIGRRYWLFGEYKEAYSILKESQRIWLALGFDGEQGLAEALVFLGMVSRWSEGDNQTAQTLYEQGLELYQKHNDQRGMALAIFNLGWIADDRDEDAQTLSQLDQSLDLYRQLGDVWGMARVSQLLGQLFLKQEIYEKARLFFEQHLSLDESLEFRQGTAVALSNLGNLYRYQRDYDRARQFYEKSLDLCHTSAIPDWGYGLYCLGMLALQGNDCSLAMQLFTEYFNSTQGFLDKIGACDFFKAMAAIAAGTNRPERAARLHGAAQALLETTDYRIPPFDMAEFDRYIRIAREQLGKAQFEALAAEGGAMTLEEAVAYALEDLDG